MWVWTIVILCFAAGYWGVMKLLAPGTPQPPAKSRRGSGVAPGEPVTSVVGADEPATLANWHVILGVDRNAPMDEVKAAYKGQMSLYHPDKVSALGEEIRAVANAKAQQINAAYEIAVRYGAG
jgi:DnaJ-domain-containing protein 1